MTRIEEGRKALRKYSKYILFFNVVEISPQGSKTFVEQKAGKLQEPKEVDNFQETVFQTQQGQYMYELTVIVTTRARPSKAPPRQTPHTTVRKRTCDPTTS